MQAPHGEEASLGELRLFLEELCCNLLRFQHLVEDGVDPEQVRIQQEVFLGVPGAFADIRVGVPGKAPYFVEIKYGYPADRLVAHLARKYGPETPGGGEADRLIVVVEREGDVDWRDVTACLRPELTLEVWDESKLLSLLRERFGVDATRVTADEVPDLRLAIDCAKGRYAFGDDYTGELHQGALLWHFGFWRLAQLSRSGRIPSRAIMPPGRYPGVAVIFADLSGFSSYVRDTRDDAVVRHALTSFYSKGRYQVLNAGGMLNQFVGDSIMALFGVPEAQADYEVRALQCAAALLDIGASVANDWQRHLDLQQDAAGCHIGMALGDLNIVSMRPFSRAYMGAIGDAINIAARLTSVATDGEIVVSNNLYQRLPPAFQSGFHELEAIDAKNIGRIQAWGQSLRKAPSGLEPL
jgi:class 3 adenylate cyclase